MLPSTVELPNLEVRIKGPLHIGTGFARGLVDRTVARGRDGLVYVPASALKGKAREACESLARLSNLGECGAPHPQAMTKEREKCIVCHIFGAPAQPATLRWHSAPLTPEWAKAFRPFPASRTPSEKKAESRTAFGQVIVKTQVQLSRTRGLAAEARLYTSEFAAEGLAFVAQPALTGRLCLTPMSGATDVYYELVLLLAGLKLVNALGGGLSRGAGECEIELPPTIRVDGKDLSVKEHLERVGELEYYQIAAEVKT